MKVLKGTVCISDDPELGTTICKIDAIEYDGKIWLVPEWLDKLGEGWSMPVRIICLDTLQHQRIASGNPDFVVNNPIPKSVLDGKIPPQSDTLYVVVENPNIKVPRTH